MRRIAIILFLFALFVSGLPTFAAAQNRLYLASPLGFSETGRHFKDEILKPALTALGFMVVDPWTLVDPKQIQAIDALPDVQRKTAWEKLDPEIGKQNRTEIDRADFLLAILDGSDVDSGTAAEIGYAFGQGKKIFGYRSDFRLAADNPGVLINLQVEYFISASGGKIVRNVSQLSEIVLADGVKTQLSASAAAPKTSSSSITPPTTTKAPNRSILDAFTIFPFAILLTLALGEAFKLVISEKHEPFVDSEKLYALASFLLLILPFYQGMNKYLLSTYGESAQGPSPHPAFIIIDGLSFMAESALFFAMSRTLDLKFFNRFYWLAIILLTIDSVWGLTVDLHSNTNAAKTVEQWVALNIITIILAAPLNYFFGKVATDLSLRVPAMVGLLGMLIRTVVDYKISWDFYFGNS